MESIDVRFTEDFAELIGEDGEVIGKWSPLVGLVHFNGDFVNREGAAKAMAAVWGYNWLEGRAEA